MNQGIPAWWLISIGVVLIAWHALALMGNHPNVQRISANLGVQRFVAWRVSYPPWQSANARLFGRIATILFGLGFIVWGIFSL
jgi:hypothetical protein